MLISFFSISCTSPSNSSSNDDDEKIKTELEGAWEGNEDLNGGTWTITFTEYTGLAVKLDGTESFNFSFTLNKSVNPNQLDMTLFNCTGTAIPYENKASLGNYQIIGNDLTLTSNEPDGGYRPIAFVSRNDDPATLDVKESCRNWNLIRN